MREVKWTPPIEEGQEPKFKGHVMVKVPTTKERLENMEQVGIKYNAQGEILGELDMISTGGKLVDIASKMVILVDLELIEDGTKYSSFEDLTYDNKCDSVIMDLGKIGLRGVRPGKNLNP